MYTEEDLESAVQVHILTPETAEAFRQHAASRKEIPVADEEPFHLMTGFNDLFVALSSILVLIAIYWLGSYGKELELGNKYFFEDLGFYALLTGVVSWGLAEFFVRKRHLAFTAIILFIAFLGSGILSVFQMLETFVNIDSYYSSIIITGLALFLTWLHWKRFKVPISIAVSAAVFVFGVWNLISADYSHWISYTMWLVCGVVVFSLAMYFDSQDTQRLTRRSDVAFWLHLLASPLLVHPIFTLLLDTFGTKFEYFGIAISIILYLLISLASLLIDRRAFMVSALSYVIYAVYSALNILSFAQKYMGLAIALLFIGCMLLLLSAYWHRARHMVLKWMPQALVRKLPNTQ